MIEWKNYALSDFCNAVKDGTHDSPKKQSTGKLLVTSKNIKGSRLDTSTAYFISLEDFDAVNKRSKVDKFDVLLSMIGTVGEVCIIKTEPDFAIKNVGLLKPDTKLQAYWLYYYLLSESAQQKIRERLRGTTQQYLPLGEIRNFPVHYPANETIAEKTIAILTSLDDKTELNRQINQTLEEMAQAIFKSWFVDFDPTRAKVAALESGGGAEDAERAAMRAISGKSDEELSEFEATALDAFNSLKSTASFFPSALQDSELGEIPEGWEVSTLSTLIELTGGGTPKRSDSSFWNGEIPWFSIKDIPSDGNVFVIDTKEKITSVGLKKSSTKLLKKGTTIITARGTVGKLALLAEDMCMNQSCYGVNGKKVGPYYNYFNLREAVATLQRNTHGAVFDTITTRTFDTYQTSFCGVETALHYDQVITPLLTKIEANLRENLVLTEMRDTLLPKLLSGEIDLSNITAATEGVA